MPGCRKPQPPCPSPAGASDPWTGLPYRHRSRPPPSGAFSRSLRRRARFRLLRQFPAGPGHGCRPFRCQAGGEAQFLLVLHRLGGPVRESAVPELQITLGSLGDNPQRPEGVVALPPLASAVSTTVTNGSPSNSGSTASWIRSLSPRSQAVSSMRIKVSGSTSRTTSVQQRRCCDSRLLSCRPEPWFGALETKVKRRKCAERPSPKSWARNWR